MNELKIIIKAVTADAQKNMQAVKKELQGISTEAKSTGDKFGAAMKGIAKATTIAITAITAIIAAIVALGKSTLDSQKQLAQLNSAFLAAGKTVKDAASVYKNFFRFLGESDTATEASNLLIKLTQDEKNLTEWTKILQGVYASFPDSLPIEALVESANETARVGQVTGNLADALNWMGENEDAFNEKLAQTASLEEREALIRNTLNNLYGNAAEIYEQNNKALLEHNESQAVLQTKTAELGATVTPLLTVLNQLGSTIVSVVKPAFEVVIPYIAGFVMWLTEAINRVAAFFGVISGSSKSVEAVGDRTAKALEKTKAGTKGVVNGLNGIKKAAEEAKRAAMGFDELNVVPSGKSGAGAGVSADTGINIPDMGGITDIAVNLEDFKQKAQQVKEDIDAWLAEWGGLLAAIGGILAALSLKSLLNFTGLAKVLAKVAGWLGAVIALLKEGNSFWAVMGAAFPKLAAVFTKIGTAIAGAAKAVAAFVGGLSAGTIAVILAIVVALASAVYYLWKNWDGVVASVKNFFNENVGPRLEGIKETINGLWEAIKDLGQVFVDLGLAIWNALPESFRQWMADAAAAVWEVIKSIGEWFASIEWLEALGAAFEWLGGLIVNTVGFFIGNAITLALDMFDGLIQGLTGVIQFITGIFTGDWKKAWGGIETIFKGVWTAIKGIFGAVPDWFKKTFTDAWTAVKNVFSKGGKIFDGIKDGILSGLKTIVNAIINGINKVIKVPFDGLNSALKKIRDVEIAGFKPFDWIKTISVPQIPQLARGGIVDRATLAMIGERGKEAVVPLENNTEWIDKLVDRLATRQEAPSKIVLMLDGKELGWANINSINNITRQTGALQLTLA